MKVFIHDYSLALFAMVCIIFMIFTLSPISVSTKNAMFNVITTFSNHTTEDDGMLDEAWGDLNYAVTGKRKPINPNKVPGEFYVGYNEATKTVIFTADNTRTEYTECTKFNPAKDVPVEFYSTNPQESLTAEHARIITYIKPTSCESMFRDFAKLTDVEGLEKILYTRVTTTKEMFRGCRSIESINMGDVDFSTVTNTQGMFYGCQKLANLDISHLDLSNVTIMSEMFKQCYALTPFSFNTSKKFTAVTDMSAMFYQCAITSLDFSNFDTSNVTTMDGMFFFAKNLREVNWGTTFIKKEGCNVSWMFGECPANRPKAENGWID